MDRGFINSKSTDPWDHMDPDPQPWIKAHKVVLGLVSEVFLALFSTKYAEGCRKVNKCFVDYGS
jgi:hypothetical protein